MLKKLSGYALALIGFTLLLSSCKKDYESIQSVDGKTLQDYIAANHLNVLPAPDTSGFYYQILTPGTGATYKNPDSVLYSYIVKSLANGTVYSQNDTRGNIGTYVGYSNVFPFSYKDVVTGVQFNAIRTVLGLLSPGGSARILLPSYLAFGKNGVGVVPSNENIDLYITTYPEKSQIVRDDDLIKQYNITNNLGLVKDVPSGVYYNVEVPGTGDPIQVTSTITAKYTAKFLDGTVFDSSTDGTFSSVLSSLIQGWQKIIPPNVKKGGKIRMVVPSGQAYGTGKIDGTTNNLTFPANVCIDFEIEITDVSN